MKQEIIKLTKELVKFKSTSDNFDEREKVIDFIISFISSRTKNVQIKKFRKENKFSKQIITSLHIFNPEQKHKPSLLLLGHVDVVPGDNFFSKQNKNFIFGRGSGDMKSGVALSLFLFLKHYKEKNVQLLITNDEEIGGHAGTGEISKKIKPDFVIALEPTNFDLRIVEKGAMQVEIIIKTLGGHSSKPWKNLSAIDIMLEFISEIKEEFKNPDNKKWQNTLNIGGIIGGNINKDFSLGSSNIIANTCKIKIDIRLIESFSHEDALIIIKDASDKIQNKLLKRINSMELENEFFEIIVKDPDVVVEHLITDRRNLFVQKLKKSIEKIRKTCNLTKAPAASDARFFSSKGITSVVFGAKSINHHGKNEHVDVSSLFSVFDILNDFIENY